MIRISGPGSKRGLYEGLKITLNPIIRKQKVLNYIHYEKPMRLWIGTWSEDDVKWASIPDIFFLKFILKTLRMALLDSVIGYSVKGSKNT